MSATGLGGCHAIRVRGFPWTPIMSNKLGRVSRAGFVVSGFSDRERNGAGRVSREPAPWSPMISDYERGVERVSCAWIRGLAWSPIMSAMGPDECHAVRVRGEWQWLDVTRLMVSHKSSGRVTYAWVRGPPWSLSTLGGCHVVRSWSVMVSDHERQGLRGCHALGFVVSQHLRS